MQGTQAPWEVCYGLKKFPQIWGEISIEPILQRHPPLLQAVGVQGDAQQMGSYDWFCTLKANKGDQGFYYFAKHATKGLQAVTKIKKSLGN